MKTIETISNSPFRHLISTIGELPTSFTESMSYYELLAWLCNYIEKTVIPAVNNNAEAVKELQDALVELKAYVDNYFNNLDVQEEINNKLDAMAEDGTLDEIINQEIFGELNSKITNAESDIDKLEKKTDFANLKLVQDFIYQPVDQPGNNFQGATVDENNIMWVYNQNNFPYGDIVRFNTVTHQYVDTISNVKFNHGNSICYVNGDIYVALNKTDAGDATNKDLLKYNVATGTSTTISGFTNVEYTSTFGVCEYNNKLFVGLLNGADYTEASDTKYVLFDPTTQTSVEYTLDRNQFYIDDNVLCDIEVIEGKLYLLTTSKNNIYEMVIDDVNHTLTVNKVYYLGLKDQDGLDFCEFQSISLIPSGAFGGNCFALTCVDFDNEGHANLSLKAYIGKFGSNLNPFLPPKTRNYDPQRRIDDIYVNREGGSSLLEDGSSTYPFKSVNRAIQYFNNPNLNIAIREILITDDSDYYIGKQTNKNLCISWLNQPTIHFEELVNCHLQMQGQNNATFVKIGTDYIRFRNCEGIIKNFTTSSRIRIDTGSNMHVDTFNQAVTVEENFVIDRSTVVLNPTNMTGGTNRILEVDNGSSVQIPSALSGIAKRARNGSNIIVAES